MEKLDDVLMRLGENVQARSEQEAGLTKPKIVSDAHRPSLLPERHSIRDFFIAEVLDWALKDDRHSMEHPMFSLSKKPDKRIRRYEHNDISVTITPQRLGSSHHLGQGHSSLLHQRLNGGLESGA
jgi:hypothetical protein